MEVQLRAPAKSVFIQLQKHEKSFLRKYKKSLNNTREYFRLMDADFNPIKNFPYYKVKQLFELDLLINDEGKIYLKDGLTIADKRKKIKA